jgi:tRNA 2-thiouridine synthesizing protein A
MSFDKELDTRGMNCPLPILKTKKALADMTAGHAGSVKDMQAFANQTGNTLVSSAEEKGEYIFMMQKK